MNAVQIVTISRKTPIFKGDEKAERIEMINLEEVGFNLISQKDLYQPGDIALYIQPDYCIPDIPLFESFIRPNGDESKSMLGKVEGKPRRIRAKKFNFSIQPFGDPIYSNGILLPLEEVNQYMITKNLQGVDYEEALGVYKYEEPEVSSNCRSGIKAKGGNEFPSTIYKTDEENINNKWKFINYPITLVGTEKVDGSSITIGIIKGKPFIGSRKLVKPLVINKVVGRRSKTFIEKLLFWKKFDLNIYQEQENDDEFVKYGKSILDTLTKSREDNILIRGELSGQSLRGSGNKNNPHSKLPINVRIFGVDHIDIGGYSKKVHHQMFEEFKQKYTQFEYVNQVFDREFNSQEEITETCNNYFKSNLIEGIVLRTKDSSFSVKFMCDKYDSLK